MVERVTGAVRQGEWLQPKSGLTTGAMQKSQQKATKCFSAEAHFQSLRVSRLITHDRAAADRSIQCFQRTASRTCLSRSTPYHGGCRSCTRTAELQRSAGSEYRPFTITLSAIISGQGMKFQNGPCFSAAGQETAHWRYHTGRCIHLTLQGFRRSRPAGIIRPMPTDQASAPGAARIASSSLARTTAKSSLSVAEACERML